MGNLLERYYYVTEWGHTGYAFDEVTLNHLVSLYRGHGLKVAVYELTSEDYE